MKFHQNRHREDDGSQRVWLTTFNDMITLLMVFFVMVFSMSNLDQKKVGNFVNSLQSALGVLAEGAKVPVSVLPEEKTDLPALDRDDAPDTTSELDHVAHPLKQLDLETGINAEFSKKAAVITLDEALLFGMGKADINPGGRPVLNRIAGMLKQMKIPIRIEGHTDNTPVRSGRYPSNWELSTARAVNVLKYMIDKGGLAPQRLSAVGYGDSRPAAPNDTPRNRLKNRRVEIVMVTRNPV